MRSRSRTCSATFLLSVLLSAALLPGPGSGLARAADPVPPVPAAPAEEKPKVEAEPAVPTTEPAAGVTEGLPGSLPGTVPGLNDAEARRVRREGVVVRPFNIQAPSFYALKARDSGRIINFLMTTRAEPLNWREYRGRTVIVSGREYLDRRPLWRGIPLLNVDTIEAVR